MDLQVRVSKLSLEAQFASHLDVVASSGVVVGRTGPLLATAALLLQPGALLLELLPFKFEWHGLSAMYRNLTESTGSLRYAAWRPTDAKWAAYASAADARCAQRRTLNALLCNMVLTASGEARFHVFKCHKLLLFSALQLS